MVYGCDIQDILCMCYMVVIYKIYYVLYGCDIQDILCMCYMVVIYKIYYVCGIWL